MFADEKLRVQPRIIIHGGAGNILRENMPPKQEQQYREALLNIVQDANKLLLEQNANAIDVAAHAVSLLENNPLFNSGRGACFTRAGTNELEASIMVSRGSRKRGVGVMRLSKVKNPVKLAREMLLRGEELTGGGALTHCQVAGEQIEHLAEEWGLETVKPSYFMTRRLWDQHRRALGKDYDDATWQDALRRADESAEKGLPAYSGEDLMHDIYVEGATWKVDEYLPQGTVGAVVMDSTGTICAATSTGGITNKLPGRIGDTPTIGAGFWSEEWLEPRSRSAASALDTATTFLTSCWTRLSGYQKTAASYKTRAVGMSGTGAGDSFLRVNAVRTAAAMTRFSTTPEHTVSLAQTVRAVAGPHGVLQQSAGEHWGKTGEGEGGIIGIEFDGETGRGTIVADFNCGGMFRGWIDGQGTANAKVFR